MARTRFYLSPKIIALTQRASISVCSAISIVFRTLNVCAVVVAFFPRSIPHFTSLCAPFLRPNRRRCLSHKYHPSIEHPSAWNVAAFTEPCSTGRAHHSQHPAPFVVRLAPFGCGCATVRLHSIAKGWIMHVATDTHLILAPRRWCRSWWSHLPGHAFQFFANIQQN